MLLFHKQQNKWAQWLHLAEWWYNYTYHMSTKMFAFKSMYGYEPPKWKDFYIIEMKLLTIKYQLEEIQKVIQTLK